MKIGVSACLLGHNVRYDATNKKNNELIEILKDVDIISICPEVLGGLSVPHFPCEIKDNVINNSQNEDMTSFFVRGSNLAYNMIKDCDFLILKTKSPSCGYQKIYDGSFSGKLIDGNGLFAKLCIENNIRIYTENDIEQIRNIG